jgi:chromosome segregation ATPase
VTNSKKGNVLLIRRHETMDSVRAMCKAKDLALQDLQNRCRAAEALCKVLDRQGSQFEAANLELKERVETLEESNFELKAKVEALALENQELNKALVEASNEVDQVCKCQKSQISVQIHKFDVYFRCNMFLKVE